MIPSGRGGWVGLTLAVATALAWDGWALTRGHQCASAFARQHPLIVGACWTGLAFHFWLPGQHRWDPLHRLSLLIHTPQGAQ